MSEYSGFILVNRNTWDYTFLSDVTGCLKTQVLPVSLDCPCLIAPSVFSNVYCNELIVQYFLTRYDLLIAIFYRKDNLERLATRRGNQTRTIQRDWQHRVHKAKTKTNKHITWRARCVSKEYSTLARVK
jgi:hypothetical protein